MISLAVVFDLAGTVGKGGRRNGGAWLGIYCDWQEAGKGELKLDLC